MHRRGWRKSWGSIGIALMVTLAGACSSTSSGSGAAPGGGGAATAPEGGLPTAPRGAAHETGDREVTFDSKGVTVHGSLRMPKGRGAVPAAVILAGSGPTDRDGNSKMIEGDIGTLKFLADQLEADGVASLRYDKLATGKTGVGPYVQKPTEIDFEVFVQEARDALAFLASQPDIDASHLLLVGHSEGGLIAQVVGNDPGGAPSVSGLALINPVSQRYLDLLASQLRPQLDPSAQGVLQQTIDAVRAGQPLPANLPLPIATIFSPATFAFLRQADQADPATLARSVAPATKVLITCSEKDIQVACPPVQALSAAFPPGMATFATLAGTDHVLKEVQTSDGSEYAQPLEFSKAAKDELKTFVDAWKG